MDEDKEIEDAVEAVDRMEDEAAEKREKEKDDYDEKNEDEVVLCPKCKSLVTEADFVEDEFSEMGATGIASKINCSKCGYNGMPIEMSREDYLKLGKK